MSIPDEAVPPAGFDTDVAVALVGAPSLAVGTIIDGFASRGVVGGCIAGFDVTVDDCTPADSIGAEGGVTGALAVVLTGGFAGEATGKGVVAIAEVFGFTTLESLAGELDTGVGPAAITTPAHR